LDWVASAIQFCFVEELIIKDYQINEEIVEREVMVIDAEGKSLGVMTRLQALEVAQAAGLDLVKVGQGQTPTCKLMDYDKFRYDTIKKEKESKKNQKVIKIKEVQLSIGIDTGDLATKAKNASKFVADGDKVRVVIRMRGRQNKRPELGIKVLNDFVTMVTGCVVEQAPSQEGNTLRMTLAPQKIK